MKYKRLGEMLVDVGAITEDQLQEALKGQKGSGDRLGTYLEKHGYITEEQLVEILKMQLGIDFIDLNKNCLWKKASSTTEKASHWQSCSLQQPSFLCL